MERAVIYARYSSDHQREESIDAQVRACREYCQRKGYLVTKIYADEAKSGKSIAKREQYKKCFLILKRIFLMLSFFTK